MHIKYSYKYLNKQKFWGITFLEYRYVLIRADENLNLFLKYRTHKLKNFYSEKNQFKYENVILSTGKILLYFNIFWLKFFRR